MGIYFSYTHRSKHALAFQIGSNHTLKINDICSEKLRFVAIWNLFSIGRREQGKLGESRYLLLAQIDVKVILAWPLVAIFFSILSLFLRQL